MNIPPTTRAFLTGASLVAAQGFAFAFGLLGVLSHLVTLYISEFNLELALTMLLFALAGGGSAAHLASGTRWRPYTVLFALAGFIGGGGGYILSTFLLTWRLQPEKMNATSLQAIYIAQFALIGALLGLFMGIAVGHWRTALLLILAGGLGFGIGYLVQVSLNDLIGQWLGEALAQFTRNEVIRALVASLLWGFGSAICGFLGGATLGFALER